MGYEKHGDTGVEHAHDLLLAFLTELGISDGKHLVQDQNLGLHNCGDGKSKP